MSQSTLAISTDVEGEAGRRLPEDDLLQLVTFRIADEEFGVDILAVREIIRPTQITVVPHAASFIEGVINLRGNVIPVINMRTRFSLPSATETPDTRIVIIEQNEKNVGFLVDGVSKVLRIGASTMEPPPQVVSGVDSEYIRAVGKMGEHLLILLDVENIMNSMSVAQA